MSAKTVLLTVIGVLAASGYVAGRLLESVAITSVTKPLPVLAMLVAVLTLGERRDRSTWLVAVGLFLSAVGDVVIAAPVSSFIGGLASFLLGHVAYVVAFSMASPTLAPRRAVLPFAYGLGAYLTLASGLGDMAIPVLVYILVICAMLWRAGAVAAAQVAGGGLALVGATLFVASDTALAIDRFRAPLPWSSVIVMSTYWAGQLGIALSAIVRASTSPARDEGA